MLTAQAPAPRMDGLAVPSHGLKLLSGTANRPLAERLRGAGASIALLAGSGSTVFGIFESRPDVSTLGFPADVRVITTWTSDRVERVTVDR